MRSYILPEDLAPLVQDVVDTHPGLAFLKEATEFHSRYVHTVIARIFYNVNRSWSGRISIAELKKSDLLEVSRERESSRLYMNLMNCVFVDYCPLGGRG